jgi:F0F1-type ATP synthase membrane subunit c/vacuolar-type H+-ATPase subunit K
MAENVLIVQIDLEKGDTKTAFSSVTKDAKKAGKKSGERFSEGFKSSLSSLTKIATLAGSIITGIITKESIEAAARQEDAINSLNSALQITNKFSEETSQSLQEYASSLQAITKFGDEAILETQALIQSLGNLDEKGLKRATAATLDLAAALRIDLNSAATLVGKAAAGEVGSFSRYGVSIKKAETNAETFARALDALERKFGGAAEKQINTFSGAVQQLSNTFGDLLEEIGFIITESPELTKFIKQANGFFQGLGKSVKEFAKDFSFTKAFIRFADDFTTFVLRPLELVGNVVAVAKDVVSAGFAAIISSAATLARGVSKALSFVGLDTGVGAKIEEFAVGAQKNFEKVSIAAANSFGSILDTPLSEKLTVVNEELRASLDETNAIVEEKGLQLNDTLNNALTKPTKEAAETIKGAWDNLSIGFTQTSDVIKEQSKKTAAIIKSGLVKGISGGIQNLVTSLANGENAFENFGKFILGTIGDLAIQLGQFFIAEGIAVEALNAISGTGAIAAGAALVTLGSLLKSFSGGGASASSGGAASPVSQPSFEDETQLADAGVEDAEFKEQQNIQLVVQGSIFNTDETGRQLTDLLNDNFETTGASLTGARFA